MEWEYTGDWLKLSKDHRTMDQDALLARARNLETEALAEIHDAFYPIVYRFVRFRMEDEQVVEDISAEVFLRLLDNFHRRGGDMRDVRAWLLGTANNLINDHLRRKYRKPTDDLEDHESLPDVDTPEQAALHSERKHEVRQAFNHLTDEQRYVLILRFTLECSLEDTAEMMHKSIGAVKTLQFRALAALRKLLEIKR